MSEHGGMWDEETRFHQNTLQHHLSRKHIAQMLEQLSHDELINHVYILERQRSELQGRNKALQESELKYSVLLEHYRLLYLHAPIGYITIDYNGLIMKANQTIATLLDYELSDLLRESLQSLMTNHEAHAFLKQLKKFRQSGQGKHETRLISKKSGMIDVCLEGNDFEIGEAIHLNIFDIREFKASQAQYQMYAIAMHESECAMALIDHTGIIINGNKSLCQKMHIQPQEIQGLALSKVYTLQHSVDLFTEVKQQLFKKNQWSGHVLYQHKQGNAQQYLCTMRSIRHEAIKQNSYLFTFDVTP